MEGGECKGAVEYEVEQITEVVCYYGNAFGY